MKLTIEIELGNEAMTMPVEVVDAINRSLANHASARQDGWQPLAAGDRHLISDINGNRVGSWQVEA
jgi:hypothetical protein